jgi:ribosomal protein L7/L12
MRIHLTHEERARVELHLREHQRLQAVFLVRHASGAGLNEAVEYIDALQRRLGIAPAPEAPEE